MARVQCTMEFANQEGTLTQETWVLITSLMLTYFCGLG
jgi:hypothetical protein